MSSSAEGDGHPRSEHDLRLVGRRREAPRSEALGAPGRAPVSGAKPKENANPAAACCT